MEDKTFADYMDRTKKDRLEGEIHLFCSDLEEHGYHPIDIAKALVQTALSRMVRQDAQVSENFYQEMRNSFDNVLKGYAIAQQKTRKRAPRRDNIH